MKRRCKRRRFADSSSGDQLSGLKANNIVILSLRYPVSCDTFVRVYFVLHRRTCAIPQYVTCCQIFDNLCESLRKKRKKTSTKEFFRVDFWAGDPTKHFSVKKGVFSEKGGGIQ